MRLLQNTAVYIIICGLLIILKIMKRMKLENYLWICKALLIMFYSEDLLLLICIDKCHLAAPMLMCYQGMRGFFLILRPHAETQTETQTCIQTYSHTPTHSFSIYSPLSFWSPQLSIQSSHYLLFLLFCWQRNNNTILNCFIFCVYLAHQFSP